MTTLPGELAYITLPIDHLVKFDTQGRVTDSNWLLKIFGMWEKLCVIFGVVV